MFALQGVPQLKGLSMRWKMGGWSGVAGRKRDKPAERRWTGAGSSGSGRCMAGGAVSRGLWFV